MNFVVVPDFVFADDFGLSGDFGPSGGEIAAYVVGGVIVLGLIIVGIAALAKHSKSPTKKPQEQKQDTETSPNTNLDNQLITPSGQIAIVRW